MCTRAPHSRMDLATDNLDVAKIRNMSENRKRTISFRQQFLSSHQGVTSFLSPTVFHLPTAFFSSSSTAFTLRDRPSVQRFMCYDDFYDSVNPAFISYIIPTVRWNSGSAPLPVIHPSLRSQRSDSAWLKN